MTVEPGIAVEDYYSLKKTEVVAGTRTLAVICVVIWRRRYLKSQRVRS